MNIRNGNVVNRYIGINKAKGGRPTDIEADLLECI